MRMEGKRERKWARIHLGGREKDEEKADMHQEGLTASMRAWMVSMSK